MKRICVSCGHSECDPGRACDGRRAYRCKKCGTIRTFGMQGRTRRYSEQRPGYQFHDTGAARQDWYHEALKRVEQLVDKQQRRKTSKS